jgi:hypothetical protein
MIEQQVLARGLDNAPDAFDYIYECISGSHGNEIREYVDYLYQSVSIDYRLHPDDDFEDIINRLLDDLGA